MTNFHSLFLEFISVTIILFLLILTACNKDETPNETTSEPEALFVFGNPDEGLVQFSNLSKNATSYFWDFGDSTNSDEKNPVHQYMENGNYQVILEAKKDDKTDTYSSTIEVSNVIHESWSMIGNFPGEKRYHALSFYVHNKYYVGFGNSGIPLDDFWEYDPQSENWTQKNDGPAHISGGISFVIGNYAYLGLGQDDNNFYKYDPASDSWTNLGDFPGYGGLSRLTGATAFTIGDFGYILNGKDVFTWEKEFWKYDPSNNEWEQLDDFPDEARHQSAHFILDNKVYVTCGATATGSGNQIFYDDLWEYDPATNTWAEKAEFPGQARIGAVGFTLNGKGYVGLGWESPEDWYTFEGEFYSDFYEYDPINDSWKERASFPDVTRIYSFILPFENGVWIGTGKGFNGLDKKDIWEYKIEY